MLAVSTLAELSKDVSAVSPKVATKAQYLSRLILLCRISLLLHWYAITLAVFNPPRSTFCY